MGGGEALGGGPPPSRHAAPSAGRAAGGPPGRAGDAGVTRRLTYLPRTNRARLLQWACLCDDRSAPPTQPSSPGSELGLSTKSALLEKMASLKKTFINGDVEAWAAGAVRTACWCAECTAWRVKNPDSSQDDLIRRLLERAPHAVDAFCFLSLGEFDRPLPWNSDTRNPLQWTSRSGEVILRVVARPLSL